MNHPHQLTDPIAVQEFLLAGRARLTLVSKKTGKRFTYRVAKAKPKLGAPDKWWVTYLSGQSNETDFSYAGSISRSLQYSHGWTATVAFDQPVIVAFKWFLYKLKDGCVSGDLEFWHEGRCGRCGRTLTVPESIKRGIGPECFGKTHWTNVQSQDELELEGGRMARYDRDPMDEFTPAIQQAEVEEEHQRMERKFRREDA